MTKIIVRGLETDTFSYVNFIAARVSRIWPALAVLILAIFMLGVVKLAPVDLLEYARQAKTALLFYSNHFYRSGTGYFGSEVDDRWLLHTWSLSVEWQFYMLFPLYCLAVHWLTGRWKKTTGDRAVVISALIALAVASLALSVFYTPKSSEAAFFLLPFRAWEMTVGGLLYICEPFLVRISPRTSVTLRLTGIVLLLSCMLAAAKGTWQGHWPGYLAIWPVVASVAFLAGHYGREREEMWIGFMPLQKIGLWSYSIYLWHWPVFVSLDFFEWRQGNKALATVFGLFLSIVLGFLSHRFVETQFKLRSKTWDAIKQKPFIISVSAIALCAGLSWVVISLNGLDSRIAADAKFYEVHSAAHRVKIIPEGCSNFRKPLASLVTCSINEDMDGPRILVYGDSHAQHLYAWFRERAKVRVDFYTSAGCNPYGEFNRKTPGYFCDQFNVAALKKALSAEYGTVILAGNLRGAQSASQGMCRPTAGGCESVTAAEVEEETLRVWKSLVDAKKVLVVVGQVGTAPFEIPVTAMRRRFAGQGEPLTFQDSYYEGKPKSDYVSGIAAKLNRPDLVHMVDLRSQYCTARECRIYEPGLSGPVLMDRTHFNPEWIVRNGDALLPFVQPQVRTPNAS